MSQIRQKFGRFIMDGIKALKLFNKKARRLLDSRFVSFLKEKKKLSFQISLKKGEKAKTTRILPDQEAIDAFVLTFRFFIQDNERCSFGNLNEVYQKSPISQESKDKYFQARTILNNYLDSRTNITLYGENPAKRRLLDVFVYGNLAHSNPKLEEIYRRWTQSQFVYGFAEVHFCTILEFVLRMILCVAGINEKAIKELETRKLVDC